MPFVGVLSEGCKGVGGVEVDCFIAFVRDGPASFPVTFDAILIYTLTIVYHQTQFVKCE